MTTRTTAPTTAPTPMPMPMPALAPSAMISRLDYLDAVRAFALILGIVFHASLSFTPIYIGWAVMDVSTSDIVSAFMFISHSFRMELFFLMAGFFSHKTFHGKGGRNFIQSRWVRIGIPFVVSWFILRPLIVSGWVMGAESLRGSVDVWGGLHQGFTSLGALPKDLFVGTHLWFLYYLLIITCMVLVLHFILGVNRRVLQGITRRVDTTVRWFAHARLGILALSTLTAFCLWFMSGWGMDTPDKSLVPLWPVLVIYGGFFVLGWLLYRQEGFLDQLSRLTWERFTLCLVAIVAATFLSTFSMETGHAYYLPLKAAFCLSYATMMWCLVTITIGLFKRYLNRPNKVVRYMADASYWLYLIHLPIVVWLQVAFAEVALHWTVKWALIAAITISVSLLIYDLCIRSTFVGAMLNGRRKPRGLFVRRATAESELSRKIKEV